MKIRQAFVANSSSSSFLISAPAKQKKICVSMEVDVNNFDKIDSFEAIDCLCADHNYDEATAERMKLELTFGRSVYHVLASNEDDESWSQVLYEHEGHEAEFLAQNKEVKVLEVDYED